MGLEQAPSPRLARRRPRRPSRRSTRRFVGRTWSLLRREWAAVRGPAPPTCLRVAKELGILTIAVVTKPFLFEGAQRMRNAEAGIAALKQYVDTLLVIPNENLFRVATNRTTFAEAFVVADQVLYSGIACLVDLVVQEGLINLDLADVKTVLGGMGAAMMGTGEASGEQRAVAAAEEAIVNPLLDGITLKGARSVLLS